MLINQYNVGDTFVYQNKSYTIDKYRFKINSIQNLERSLAVDVIDKFGTHKTVHFWKNSNNPNIYKDENDEYKLVEIHENDTVDMIGFDYLYGNTVQFNAIGGYKLVDEEMTFTPNTNCESQYFNLKNIVSTISNEKLRSCCEKMLSLNYTDFIKKPAAAKHHHNYIGGLLQHTYEVVKTALSISNVYNVNKDYIITAALFHDIMKIKEYSDDGKWLEYGDKIGHIVGSSEYFGRLATEYFVDKTDIENIQHIILSHHGKKEWGSPVEPKTVEAVIVHEADMISSYINPIALANCNTFDMRKDYYLI